MRRSGDVRPSWRVWAGCIAAGSALAVALVACSPKTEDDAKTVVQPIPTMGHPYFELKYRAASTARVDTPDAAWNADTQDTCYSNGVCAVQGVASTPSWGLALHCQGETICQQSTYRIVVVTPRPGVKITFDPPTLADGQTAWSAIAVDRTVPAGTLTVKYATQLASGPGTGWTIGRINTQVLCGIKQNTCPHIDARDTFVAGSPVVSGNPPPKRTSIVGRESNFVVRPAGGVGTYRLSTVSWDPSGWTYRPYQLAGTLPASLSFTDLHGPVLNLFWASGGDQHVIATATLVRSDNQEISHATTQIDYNLLLPVATVTMPAHPERISIGPRSDAPGRFLRWGNNTKNAAAIDFRYRVTNDHGYAGTISMTQTVSGSIAYTPNVGPGFGQNSTNQLDGPAFYRKPVSTHTPFGPAAYDAPAVGLRNSDTAVNVSETFSSYFMYKPNLHGDWVTLKKGAWSWTAAATLVDAATNRWCVNGSNACPGESPAALGSVVSLEGSMDFPVWQTVFNAGLPGPTPGHPYTSLSMHP
jgi:hypothetical protein